MSGRYFGSGFRVAAAVLLLHGAAYAIGPGPGGSDKSGMLIATVLAFPVLVIGAVAGALLIKRPAAGASVLLRALAGALAGLLLTAVFGAALMSNSMRDAWFFSTAVLVLGAIPAGLVGLITGGLVTIFQRQRSQ